MRWNFEQNYNCNVNNKNISLNKLIVVKNQEKAAIYREDGFDVKWNIKKSF